MEISSRHRGARASGILTSNLMSIAEPDDPEDGSHSPYSPFSSPTPKERKPYTRSTWIGIVLSVSILLIIGFFLFSRRELVQHALSSSSYPGAGLAGTIGSASGSLYKPAAVSSTVKIQSRLELEHAAKLERQAKLKGKDLVMSKTNGGGLRTGVSAAPPSPVPAAVVVPVPVPQPDLTMLVQQQLQVVHSMKHEQRLVMETDPTARVEIERLQALLRDFVPLRYGAEPYFVEMKVHFPESMSDPEQLNDATVLIQLAPLQLMPYAVFYFLQVVDTWKSGAFHRVAGHVLQAMANTPVSSLAFQEYHPDFPHVKHSLGFAGRPGGPEFYVSTVDNTQNHGPGSQGSHTEADTCFGRIADGFEVIERIKRQPGATGPAGFVSPSSNYIKITSMRLLR